ncbi:MAG: aldose epimerase [Terrimicrobiaceae bacterium]
MRLTNFQGQPVIELQNGPSRALISSGHGARLLCWSVADWEVIRWPETADWSKPQKVRGGNPVLFPFIARSFHDNKIGLWKCPDGMIRPAPMHGFARDSAFSIVSADEASVGMRLEANDTTRAVYPFDFRFEVALRLGDDSLQVIYRVTNTGQEALPWSAGHHFYLGIPASERADWQLELPCRHWASQDFSTGEIQLREPACDRDVLSNPAWIDRLHVEPDLNRICLAHEASGRTISFKDTSPQSGSWHCATTWTEKPDSDFFCVEPWSALPNAAANGMGLQNTPPGKSLEISCQILARHG